MIREVNVNKYPLITIPEGTILYSGGGDTCSICPHSYKYKGQEGTFSDGKIIYYGNKINYYLFNRNIKQSPEHLACC